MNVGKACGPDSIPIEFIRQAYHECRVTCDDGKPRIYRSFLLADGIASTFNSMLEEGHFPESWASGLISPVFKGKGDPNIPQNYRPITVGSALGKLFSQVMLARLNRWAEEGSWRASTQFGFRNEVGTSEATFLKRHVLDKSREEKKPLCAAFVDFKQAYDSVDRTLLWKCLQKLGVHGACLNILQCMYMHGSLYIKSSDGMGEAFYADLGVKQGDLLSPLFFGLFIDRIYDFFMKFAPSSGVVVGGMQMHCILYADDLVILSHRREDLQKMLDQLDDFCKGTKLKVNIEKT